MRLLIDTNVILDVLLQRPPFYQKSADVLRLANRENIELFVSAASITDICYIAKRNLKEKEQSRIVAKSLIEKLLRVVSIAAVSEKEIKYALKTDWNDFEDAVQYSVAVMHDMDGIVTRDLDDYKGAEVPIWMPEKILERLYDEV